MSEYLDNLVKCFSNSRIGVNLTTVLIDNEQWFIAKEVATILGYENAKKAITDHVDELDQKMLSCSECKELFSDLLVVDEENTNDSQIVESEEDPKGNHVLPLRNPINISNFGKTQKLLRVKKISKVTTGYL